MKLNIGVSKDGGQTINLVKKDIYVPTKYSNPGRPIDDSSDPPSTKPLYRKTLRDPSGIWYNGFLYITYTVIDWASGSSKIGFCRTADFEHFEELPQLETDNPKYNKIARCYAPAFFTADNHIYIASSAVGEKGIIENEYGERFDESSYIVPSDGNTMIHEYFPDKHMLSFVGIVDGVTGIDIHIKQLGYKKYIAYGRDFRLYKSDSLLGKYTEIWHKEITESGEKVFYEGAELIQLDNGKWRFFAQRPTKGYEYYDSVSNNLLPPEVENDSESDLKPQIFEDSGLPIECKGDVSQFMHFDILKTLELKQYNRQLSELNDHSISLKMINYDDAFGIEQNIKGKTGDSIDDSIFGLRLNKKTGDFVFKSSIKNKGLSFEHVMTDMSLIEIGSNDISNMYDKIRNNAGE